VNGEFCCVGAGLLARLVDAVGSRCGRETRSVLGRKPTRTEQWAGLKTGTYEGELRAKTRQGRDDGD